MATNLTSKGIYDPYLDRYVDPREAYERTKYEAMKREAMEGRRVSVPIVTTPPKAPSMNIKLLLIKG